MWRLREEQFRTYANYETKDFENVMKMLRQQNAYSECSRHQHMFLELSLQLLTVP